MVGDQPVAVAVGLVERIVGEAFDDVEQLLAQGAVKPGCLDALLEAGSLLDHHLGLLLATRLAQVVRLGQGVAGEALGHPHHRLLVDHQPVGVGEHLLGLGMEELDRLATVLAVGVVVVHVGAHRPRPIERDQGRDILEAVRRDRADQRPHRW